MATVVPSYQFSRAPMLSPPSDTSSPVYPERPIRPLPKRRLRSRLSSEQAESIVYPPVPSGPPPLFSSQPNQPDRILNSAAFVGEVPGAYHNDLDEEHEDGCRCHEPSDGDSDEDESHYSHRYSWPGKMMRYPPNSRYRTSDRPRVPPPHSSTSSADGYESFENTNNKKKRKIPISGAMVPAGIGMAAQSVDLPGQDERAGNNQYYASGTGVGISGAGRGRFSSRPGARQSLEQKSPPASTNTMNTYATGLDAAGSEPGIISAAIANAAEKGIASAPRGQENMSLLQRQSNDSNQPKDFTFECKSNSSNKMVSAARGPNMPATNRSPIINGSGAQGIASQGTQTSMRGGGQAQSTQANASQGNHAQQPAPSEPRKPRRLGSILDRAARQRKRQQAANNFYHPPKPGEQVWVCEFCEYEMIFGVPPRALVRQYEIKDRRERKRQAEQRRLLDKAKAKGRKNRKAKANAKNTGPSSAANNAQQNQAYDPQYDDGMNQDVDSQGDEFFDDGYDDNAPLPSPYPDQHPSGMNGQLSTHDPYEPGIPNAPPRLT